MIWVQKIPSRIEVSMTLARYFLESENREKNTSKLKVLIVKGKKQINGVSVKAFFIFVAFII